MGLAAAARHFVELAATIEALKFVVGFLGGFFGKVLFDRYQSRSKTRAAIAMLREELKQADVTCEDKIDEWDARLANVRARPAGLKEPPPVTLMLYPQVCTVAFEGLAGQAARLPGSCREVVFGAYYALIRRRENSERSLPFASIDAHGQNAIAEIKRLQTAVAVAMAALAKA